MAEETAVVETQEVPIGEVSMREFKKARAEGKDTVSQVKEVAPEVVEEAVDDETDDKPKSKGGFQRRIDRLIKHSATVEERAAALEKELTAERAKNSKTVPKTEQTVAGEPQREQFASDPEYFKALAKWEVKEELRLERDAFQKAQEQENRKEWGKIYNQKALEAQSKYDDWDEVLIKGNGVIPIAAHTAILEEIENGAEVAYYLAKHEDIAKSLFNIPPSAAIAKVWAISEKLGAGPVEETEDTEETTEDKPEAHTEAKPKSKAPAPIRPISGTTTGSTVKMDKAPYQAYKKLRAQGRTQ